MGEEDIYENKYSVSELYGAEDPTQCEWWNVGAREGFGEKGSLLSEGYSECGGVE